MTSFTLMRTKLIRVLEDWPDDRKHEKVPGMDMTWIQLAKHVVEDGTPRSRLRKSLGMKGRSRLRPILEQAVEAGVIKLRHEEVNSNDR